MATAGAMTIAGAVLLVGLSWLMADFISMAWFRAIGWFTGITGFLALLYGTCFRTPKIDNSILTPLAVRLHSDEESRRKGEWFHNPFPMWPDYRDGTVVMREDLIRNLNDIFESSRIQLLFGESGAGKTTLATMLGYRWLEEKKRVSEVYFADAADVSGDKIVDELMEVIGGTALFRTYLVIIDNTHVNVELARRVYDNRREIGKAHIYVLLVARCTRTPPEDDRQRLICEITGTSGESLSEGPEDAAMEGAISGALPVVHLRDQMFDEAVDLLFNRFAASVGLVVCKDSMRAVIRAVRTEK